MVLLITFIVIVPIIKAQPIITTTNFFQLNDRFERTLILKWNLYEVVEKPDSGSNVLWDYSSILSIEDLNIFKDTVFFVDPSSTPFYNAPNVDYKRANFCMVEDFTNSGIGNSERYFYYLVSENKIESIGKWIDSETNEIYYFNYSNPMTEIIFPFTYGISDVDSFSASFLEVSAGISVKLKGDVSISADGYGILITPEQDTLLNVLKIRKEVETTGSSVIGTDSYRYIQHIWYSPERRGPVLIIQEQFEGYIEEVVYYSEIKTTDVKEPQKVSESQISVFPNPVVGMANFLIPQNSQNKTINIYNVLGKLVRTYKPESNDRVLFNRENLPGGVYFLQIVSDNKIIGTKKFLILK